MRAYAIRRLLLGIVVLVIVSILVFLIVHLIPGDPVIAILGHEASLEEIEKLRAELWLDRPLHVQYGHWVSNFVHGDLGKTRVFNEDVFELVKKRLPITAFLAIVAISSGVLIGIPAGVVSAIRRGRFLDSVISLFANIGIATPRFWLGMMAIYLFGLKLGWFPIQGLTSPFDDLWLSIRQVIMPAVCLAVVPLAIITRQTRSSMLEVIRQDYIRTARAKGLKEWVIITRHALKNSLIPIVTLIGISVRHIVGGSVLIETVFNVPGMGRLMVSGVFNKDFLVVQACVMIMAVVVVLANLFVDMLYGWLDPRIKYE